MNKYLFLSAVLAATLSSSVYGENKFAPPAGSVLLFVGQDLTEITDYLEDVKTVPGGFMSYTSLENLEGLNTVYDEGGGVHHAEVLTKKYPGTALQIGLYLVDTLEVINRGKRDENLDRLGKWIQSTNRPVFLRIGYEFDLPQNRYDPQEYRRAFRYIVAHFRDQGITNVAYVWHSYASTGSEKLMDWYPGDKYVDWVGASYFNQFPKYISIVANTAKELKKPFMLAETSPWHMLSLEARENWYERLFAYIQEKNVAALCYINCNWNEVPMWTDQNFGNTRVQDFPTILKLWKAETAKVKYLKSSPTLFKTLGYKSPSK